MKQTLIASSTTTALAIAVNVLTNNMSNIWAWVITVFLTGIVALVTHSYSRPGASRMAVYGRRNRVRQQSRASVQVARVLGNDNDVDQS
jgi:hypothetical protein